MTVFYLDIGEIEKDLITKNMTNTFKQEYSYDINSFVDRLKNTNVQLNSVADKLARGVCDLSQKQVIKLLQDKELYKKKIKLYEDKLKAWEKFTKKISTLNVGSQIKLLNKEKDFIKLMYERTGSFRSDTYLRKYDQYPALKIKIEDQLTNFISTLNSVANSLTDTRGSTKNVVYARNIKR